MTHRNFVGWLWLLSGVPIGLALIFLPPSIRFVCFTTFVLLETGHSLSPIVLAWTHGGFRRVVLARPKKWILLPTAVFAVTLIVGVATQMGFTSFVPGPGRLWLITDWKNPFPIVAWLYWICNIYHFGMQHFGVLSLWRTGKRSPEQRRADMVLCLAITAFVMAVPPRLTHDEWVFYLMTGILSVNHWVVDIGLSSRVAKRGWLFIAGLLLAGLIGFVWMIPTSQGILIQVIPIIICARLGLGFVHFLYSRWIWKFSDPLVRATIGRDLLAQRA